MSASVEPTIFKVSFSFFSIFCISTIEPIFTLSHHSAASSIISTFFSCSSKSAILCST